MRRLAGFTLAALTAAGWTAVIIVSLAARGRWDIPDPFDVDDRL